MRIDPRDWLPEWLEAEDYLLLSAVLLLPWAFGGVEMWAYRSASLLIAGAAAIALCRHGADGLGIGRGIAWLLPAFLLAVWGAVQILPCPPGLLSILSPSADRVYRKSDPSYLAGVSGSVVPVFEERALSLVPESRSIDPPSDPAVDLDPSRSARWSRTRTLSLQTDATTERLFWYVALLLAFLLAARRASVPEVALTFRRSLFGLFGALALCGLAQAMTWNGKLLWIRPFHGVAHPFGPYVNPNHFAGVMELAVPWLAGTALGGFRASRGKPWTGTFGPLVAATAFLCLVAGIVAGSRFATVTMVISLTVIALTRIRRSRTRGLWLAGLAGALALGTVLILHTSIGGRFQSLLTGAEGGVGDNSRPVAWKASLPIVRDYWLTGTGFGTFRFVFPAYLPAGESSAWLQVHNDYLEVLLEGGIVAGILLVWLAVAYSRRVVASPPGTAPLMSSPGRLGLVLGLASLSAHAFVDFNHQMPANALLFVVVAALALEVRSRGRVRP